MTTTVQVYVEDPLQADWDDIAERLVQAINNSRDSTRKETPFYLVHGWDVQSTLKAMTEPIRRIPTGVGKVIDSSDPVMWRRESNRQREIAVRLVKNYQGRAKDRRSSDHNKGIRPAERRTLPPKERSGHTQEAIQQDEEGDSPVENRLEEGYKVWLFMNKVKPGLMKKLAHSWNGPFRMKRRGEDFSFKLELPDMSGYRFYSIVHVSHLKKFRDHGERSTRRLVTGITEADRFDFDEELLPGNS